MVAQTIELSDVLTSAIDSVVRGVWTAMPGRVESYDSTTQSANIQLTVKSGFIGESGQRDTENIAVLNGVPVVFLGGGGFRTVYPVAVGDTALVVFASRSLGEWLQRGDVVDPLTDHHHNLGDGVAFIGLRDRRNALVNAPEGRMSVGADQGATIEVRSSEIRLGSDNASSAVVVQSALDTFMAALTNAIASLASSPVSAAALSALQNQLLPRWLAGTSKVKAE